MTIPSVRDPSLAPTGKHTLITGNQQLPFTLREGTWASSRESFADQVTDRLEEAAPGFRSLILDRRVLTPVDYERVFGLTEGNFSMAL